MKTSEVLKRYNNGRKDFSGECLRGQSYQDMNLAGADFSKADIRGANFSKANLRGAKFCGAKAGADFSKADIRGANFSKANLRGAKFRGAKAGLQRRWAVFLVAASWLLSALSGIFSWWIGFWVTLAFDTSSKYFIVGVASLIVFVIFFIVTVRKGLTAGFGVFAVAVAVAGAVAVAVAVAGENLTGVAGGDISGTITNTINQLSESESPEAPTLADLLKQLRDAIASPDSGLSEKDKKKALKHLDTIGKLGVDRNNSNLQEMAENAMDALPTILKRGAGLMEFLKTHFDIELDEILDNIQSILNF